jgi:tetratricopeptide (TPR) repeat protein
VTNLFATLQAFRVDTNREPGFEYLWPVVLETYRVAEVAHTWPPQNLLDYGNAILGSLRPGMVYFGGTDPGRYIPTLLSETGDGSENLVLTQNALADHGYLQYINFRYGDRVKLPSEADSLEAFKAYVADAQARYEHDKKFPNESPQLQPGEGFERSEAGTARVSGQVAVMAINERLLKTLLQKNLNLSFALEESFPLKSFYNGANVLGPVTEISAGTANPLTADSAARALDYWYATTQSVMANPEASTVSRDAYAMLLAGQANLFQERKLVSQAMEAYQLANSLDPGQPKVVCLYVDALIKQQRLDEARQVAQNAVNLAPDNPELTELLKRLLTMRPK